jgi:hypothetical protein
MKEHEVSSNFIFQKSDSNHLKFLVVFSLYRLFYCPFISHNNSGRNLYSKDGMRYCKCFSGPERGQWNIFEVFFLIMQIIDTIPDYIVRHISLLVADDNVSNVN